MIMTPKEKAIELHAQFMKPVDGLHKYPMCFDTAKQCAIIAVNEILNINSVDKDYDLSNYWGEVLTELEKL